MAIKLGKKGRERWNKVADPLGIGKAAGVDLADPLGIFGERSEAPELDTSAEMAALQDITDEYVLQQPEQFDWLGDLEYQGIDPETLSQLEGTGLAGLKVDPKYAQMTDATLEELGTIADEGLSAADVSALRQIESAQNRNLRGQLGAMQQQMQSRGISGSGLDLIGQQQAAQGAAERQALMDLEIAAQGQGRRRQAMMDRGALAQSLGLQDYQRQADAARAQDIINRFNTQTANRAMMENVAGQNRAAAMSHAGRQATADQNVALANQRMKDIYQAKTGMAGINYDAATEDYNRRALAHQQEQQRRAAMMGAFGSAAGGIFGGMMGGPAGATGGASLGGAAGQYAAYGAYGGRAPEKQNYAAMGGKAPYCAAEGGMVPGVQNGINDPADDTFQVSLQGGEIVVPETEAQNPADAARFVAEIQASGPAGEIPARNPVMDEDDVEDIVGTFIKTVSKLAEKRKKKKKPPVEQEEGMVMPTMLTGGTF